jgi:hypothetical protein
MTEWHDTRKFIYWPDGTRVYPDEIQEAIKNMPPGRIVPLPEPQTPGRNYHFDPATMRIVEDE